MAQTKKVGTLQLTKEEVREAMRNVYEQVMMLETTSKLTLQLHDASKEHKLGVIEQCLYQVRELRAEHTRLYEIYKSFK